jgi:hypothetical protein
MLSNSRGRSHPVTINDALLLIFTITSRSNPLYALLFSLTAHLLYLFSLMLLYCCVFEGAVLPSVISTAFRSFRFFFSHFDLSRFVHDTSFTNPLLS